MSNEVLVVGAVTLSVGLLLRLESVVRSDSS